MADVTEEEEKEKLRNLGAVKSSYDLIDLAATQIENRLLLQDENLNDNPASFTNIFLENFGRLGSQSFFEQMMYKNELLPSTAIKLRSIVNKLNSEQITNIYAHPARMTFVLGYNYDRLVQLATQNGNQIVINKECIINMEGQEDFVLDHNIIIKVSNPGSINQNVYAIYDKSDVLNPNSSLSEVNNIYITSQIFYYENTKIFGMFVTGRQMTRTETTINITSDNPDFQLSYPNQLYGFELDYKSVNSDKFIYKQGLFEGNINPSGYNFSLDTETNKIDFSFNRTPEYWTPVIGDVIKVTIYTTKGSLGNFKVGNIYDQFKTLSFSYNQNRDDPQQDCLIYTDPYLSIKDAEATGGKDSMNFNQIKALAIARGSNSKILTPGDLERRAEAFGYSVTKIRNDIRCLEYRALGVLTNLNDIISSRESTITFSFNDFKINNEVSNRMITPKMIFEFNNDTGYCDYIKMPESYLEYFEHFKKGTKNQFMFPYHIRFTNNNTVDATVFNLNRDNESYLLNFEYYNNNTSFESSIMNMILNRNPITEDINKISGITQVKYSTGYYDLSFQVTTSPTVVKNIYENPDDPIIKYKLSIFDGEKKYIVNTYIIPEEIDLSNNTIIVHAYLKTDDAISALNRILIRDYSIQPLPYITNPIEYYTLPSTVDVKIYAIEKNLKGTKIITPYDNILTNKESQELYFVSTVYSIEDVILFEDYSDYISLQADLIINQKVYQRYDSDIYKTYDGDIYLYNDDGSPVLEIKRLVLNGEIIDVNVAKVLHAKGSFVYKDNLSMTKSQLIPPLMILTDKTEEELKEYNITNLAKMIKFDIGELTNEEKILYLSKFLNLTYTEWTDESKDNHKFLVDEDGNIIEDKVLDKLQDKLNSYREKILLHRAGEINIDAALVSDEYYTGIIKHIPLYDRIYAIGGGYETVNSSFGKLISSIKALQNVAPDGSIISMGIKNTSGPGDYEIYNLDTSTWRQIDNIALSFDIGIKYKEDSNTDQSSDNKVVSDTIRNFINNFEDISFSINEIFAKCKEAVPSIEYLVLYGINNYSASQVQNIRKKNGVSTVSDKLSVKQIIDNDKTDLDNDTVTFKPDITIRIIS